MKKLLITIFAVFAFCGIANATQYDLPTLFGGNDEVVLECHPDHIDTKNDRNPVIQTNVAFRVDRNYEPVGVSVRHFLNDGTYRDRANQYHDFKLFKVPNKTGWIWIGVSNSSPLIMMGRIGLSDDGSWWYQETIHQFRNGDDLSHDQVLIPSTCIRMKN